MNKYQKQNAVPFAGALICVLISVAFATVLQFFKGDVLDYASIGNVADAVKSLILLVTFILAEVLFYFCYNRLSLRFVVGCTKNLKADIWQSILKRSYVSYKKAPQGDYIAKYTNQADTVKEMRFTMLPMLWEILFRVIFVATALFFLDWRIALVTIFLLTTPLYIPKIIEKKLKTAQNNYISAVEENLSRVNDWLSGFEIIKNFSIENKINEQFRKINDNTMDKLFYNRQFGILAQLITTLISYLSYFIIMVCAAWLVLEGEFSSGDFFVAIGMIDQLSYPLISLSGIIRQLLAVGETCEELENFIKAPNELSVSSPKGFSDRISFKNITFGYDGKPPVLKDFSFEIKKGESCLIKGASGSGKTTAVNLLLRYYDLISGDIEIDGVPISEYNSTYNLITVLRQEPILFNDTLRNNLTMYGEADDKKLMSLLSNFGLDKFANEVSLDSVIEENGANLSGGEKKRICLVRAILRNTDVLILDEPLANLDSETASKIEDIILSIKDRTLLVVSHQLSENKLNSFSKILNI